MDTKAEIRAAPYTLRQVFSDEFAFSIPFYQRPYAWTEEEAGELFSDLQAPMGQAPKPVESVPSYFLGTIVLDQMFPPDAQIIDGQQRLTTLTILFAVLRKLLSTKHASQLAERIWRQRWGRSQQPRLVLRGQADQSFFKEHVQEPGGLDKLQYVNVSDLPDSQQRLASVARALLTKVESLTPPERLRLSHFALRRCLLIVVATPKRDSSFTIFTVLNKRGLDLSTVDMLKADILGEIEKSLPQEDVEDYAARWEVLEESLGRDGFADLIAYTRAIKRNARPEVSVLSEFRRYVIGERRGAQLAEVIKDVLEPLGQALLTIRNGTYYKDGTKEETLYSINRLFGWLNRLEHADWTPSAMEFLRRHQGDPAALLTFFTDLERLAVYLMMRGWDADQRGKRYRALLAEILNDAEKPSQMQLTDAERKDLYDRLDGDIYNRSAQARRYILLRLDDVLAGGNVIYHDERNITIEHVLPQNPSANSPWLDAWKRCWASAAVRKKWLHRLANLVLLYSKVGTRAGNRGFVEKKRIYFPEREDGANDEGQSPFALTNSLRDKKDWSVHTVEARQAELLDRLNDLWQLGQEIQSSEPVEAKVSSESE
jgi:uncharacterized protein DUF262/uncharacterized protein DUF1524